MKSLCNSALIVIVAMTVFPSSYGMALDQSLSAKCFSFKLGESLTPKDDFLSNEAGQQWFEVRDADLAPFKKVSIYVTPKTKRVYMYRAEAVLGDAAESQSACSDLTTKYERLTNSHFENKDGEFILNLQSSNITIKRESKVLSFLWKDRELAKCAEAEGATCAAITVGDKSDRASLKLKLPTGVTIAIPQGLEVQGGKYKEICEKITRNVMDIDWGENRIVLQQAGLNDRRPSAFKEYARGIYDYSSTVLFTGDMLREASKDDLKEISDAYREQMQTASSMYNQFGTQRIVRWDGCTVVKLGNKYALKLSYSRQLKTNPIVECEQYQIGDEKGLHTINISYRKEDVDKWKPIMKKFLDSIEIP